MGRVRSSVTRHGLDLVICVAAVFSATGTALRHDGPEGWRAWAQGVVVAAVVLVLLLRRRYPIAAPAVVWGCSAGLTFVDDQLVTGQVGLFATGMCAALLLGNLSNLASRAWGSRWSSRARSWSWARTRPRPLAPVLRPAAVRDRLAGRLRAAGAGRGGACRAGARGAGRA
jgi:hypothetical protein